MSLHRLLIKRLQIIPENKFPGKRKAKNETCTLFQYYNNTLKLYNCSKNKKVSSTRHDYRFTYRKIGYRFVVLLACILHRALNIYCNIYHQVQVATLTSPSVQIHFLRRRRKNILL